MNDSVLTRRALGAVVTTAVLTLGIAALAAGGAGAAGAKVATEVHVFDAGTTNGDFIAFGEVKSKRKKCRANRNLILQTSRSGQLRTTDSGRSSSGGGFLLLTKNPNDDIAAFKVKAKRKKLRSGAICKGAAFSYTFGGP